MRGNTVIRTKIGKTIINTITVIPQDIIGGQHTLAMYSKRLTCLDLAN